MQKFKQIWVLAARCADQEAADVWDDARTIQKLAKEIQPGTPAGHDQGYPEMQDRGHGWVASTNFPQSKKT